MNFSLVKYRSFRFILSSLLMVLLFQNCDKEDNYSGKFGELFLPDIFNEICTVCAFGKNPDAASYNADNKIHPILLYGSRWNGDDIETFIHKWSDDLPSEWWPNSIENLELVACVGDEYSNDLGNCVVEGTNTHIAQLQFYLSVRVHEAKTGREFASRSFSGSYPPNCDGVIVEYVGDGSHVQLEDILLWLEEIVVGNNK